MNNFDWKLLRRKKVQTECNVFLTIFFFLVFCSLVLGNMIDFLSIVHLLPLTLFSTNFLLCSDYTSHLHKYFFSVSCQRRPFSYRRIEGVNITSLSILFSSDIMTTGTGIIFFFCSFPPPTYYRILQSRIDYFFASNLRCCYFQDFSKYFLFPYLHTRGKIRIRTALLSSTIFYLRL